jgi:copper transport protein
MMRMAPAGPTRRRFLRQLGAWLALAAALFGHAGPASAHAVVLETVPADGAVVAHPPEAIAIRFNEPVGLIAAQVLDADGDPVPPDGAPQVEGGQLRIPLPPDLAPGSYIASYRVASIDGHPVGGSVVFSVDRASEHFRPPPAEAEGVGWTAATVMARTLLNAGILGGAGGLLFLVLVAPLGPGLDGIARRSALIFSTAGGIAAILSIGIHGGLLLGGPASSLLDPGAWRAGFASSFGATALVAGAGLSAIAAALRPSGPAALRPLACAGAIAALVSFALSGHVVTAGPRWLTVPLLVAHVAAAAFWAGALVPLLLGLRRLGKAAAPAVERFSHIALAAVAVLLLAGLVIAILQVGSVGALARTSYGLILVAKLAMVAGLVALAAVNKIRLTPALRHGAPGAAPALGHTIGAEIALVAAILVATAALGTMPPPRAIVAGSGSHAGHGQASLDAGLAITVLSAGRSAEIVLDSARSGVNRAEIAVRDPAGAAIEASEVTFIAANRAAGVEPIRRAATRTDSGAWHVDDLLLVPAGEWSVRLDVLVSDFEKVAFETSFRLQ